MVLKAPETGNNAADDLDFLQSGRQWDAVKAEHKQHSKARDLLPVKK
jgi:sensor domain CHASE-containing protein